MNVYAGKDLHQMTSVVFNVLTDLICGNHNPTIKLQNELLYVPLLNLTEVNFLLMQRELFRVTNSFICIVGGSYIVFTVKLPIFRFSHNSHPPYEYSLRFSFTSRSPAASADLQFFLDPNHTARLHTVSSYCMCLIH